MEKPHLTYRTHDEAVETRRNVLNNHGRRFTIDIEGEVISFLNEHGGALAVIKPVRALGPASV